MTKGDQSESLFRLPGESAEEMEQALAQKTTKQSKAMPDKKDSNKNGSNMIQVGGLWKSITSKEEPMLSGYLGNARIVILPNGFKKEDKHPDYIFYIAEGDKGKKATKNADDI